MSATTRLPLVLAGVATIATGAVHLALPALYDWEPHLGNLVDSLRWALRAINAFFSVLLLLAGTWTIRAARAPRPDRAAIAGLAIFWLFSLGYQVMSPFPHPMVRVIAPVFSLALFVCYAGALFLVRRSSVGAQA